MFKNMRSYIDVELATNDFVDCIFCRILPVNLICISVYIPPINSRYFSTDYFDNLKMILMNYTHVPAICIGDMNSRFGDPQPGLRILAINQIPT